MGSVQRAHQHLDNVSQLARSCRSGWSSVLNSPCEPLLKSDLVSSSGHQAAPKEWAASTVHSAQRWSMPGHWSAGPSSARHTPLESLHDPSGSFHSKLEIPTESLLSARSQLEFASRGGSAMLSRSEARVSQSLQSTPRWQQSAGPYSVSELQTPAQLASVVHDDQEVASQLLKHLSKGAWERLLRVWLQVLNEDILGFLNCWREKFRVSKDNRATKWRL